MKKIIIAANQEKSDGYTEAYDNCKDNFDYALDGCDKLSRDSKDGERLATQLLLELNAGIDAVLSKIASNIQ